MGTSYGASKSPSLFQNCILWAPLSHSAGVSGDIDEFPIIPTGVTVTNTGTFVKDDLGNNKSILAFDGSTNRIALIDNTAWYLFGSDFTITGWVRFAASAFGLTFGQENDAGLADCWSGQWSRSSGVMNIVGTNSSVTVFNYAMTTGVVPTIGTWYHFTIQKSGSLCLMYINAISRAVTTNTAWGSTADVALPLWIGESGGNTRFAGNLKDLMIFTRALSLPEIKLLMNRTHPVTGEGLIDTGRYWRLS